MKTATALMFFLCAVWCLPKNVSSNQNITIAYTAGTSGKLAACGCPGDPYGGLSERATLVSKLRAKEGPILLLDAGNMVSLFGDFQERAACVMRLMNLMAYDAAGVGRQEMFRNTREALSFAKAAKFPLLSATMTAKNSSNLLFEPYTVRTVGGVRVGIVAVCDTNAYIPDINRVFDYSILPLDKALDPIIGKMKGTVDYIIVLSQMDEKADAKLLARYPAVDLVIEGYGNSALEKPIASGRGFIVAPGSRGQYVGLLTLEKSGTSAARVTRSELIEVLDIPADKKADEIIRAYYRSAR